MHFSSAFKTNMINCLKMWPVSFCVILKFQLFLWFSLVIKFKRWLFIDINVDFCSIKKHLVLQCVVHIIYKPSIFLPTLFKTCLYLSVTMFENLYKSLYENGPCFILTIFNLSPNPPIFRQRPLWLACWRQPVCSGWFGWPEN